MSKVQHSYGRLTGKTGVCLSTLGPGATNLVTPAAYAQLGAMPMLMITGQKPIKKSKQGRFQIIDVVDMMRPITKFTRQIVHANNIPSLVREAIRLAEEERPGAVHLELPEDIAAEQTDAELFQASDVRRPAADTRSIKTAAAVIAKAERPLLLIGAAANRKRTSRALEGLLEKCGIPFFTTQMGKGVVDERHSLYLGCAALSDKDYLHLAIEHSDLIINVGHDVIEKPPFFMTQGGTPVVHINFNSAVVDSVYFPQVEVVGDIANSIFMLTEQLGGQPYWKCRTHEKVRAHLNEHLQEKAADSSFPVIPQRLVSDVRAAMPSDGIIALDNGIYKIWFARNYPAHQTNTVLLDNALATMGAGLPSAMAASLIYPERKVAAICGDGGFMMNSQELETAVRLGLNLSVVILNDSAYGMIKWKQEGLGFDSYGLDFQNPDFVRYAESYGAEGHRVERTEDFEPLLRDTLSKGGVHVIDLPVNYEENKRVLIDELNEKVCEI